MKLFEERCGPVEAGQRPMLPDEIQKFSGGVPQWIVTDKSLERDFKFKDFRQALEFVNKVAELSEAEDHHPDISIAYNKVRITFSTHKIGGISKNDFIMAAKVDRIILPQPAY